MIVKSSIDLKLNKLGQIVNSNETCEALTKYSNIAHACLRSKIQQTEMLVTCQRFGDWFLFGPVWPYYSNQKNIMKVGSKSLLLTCSSNKL